MPFGFGILGAALGAVGSFKKMSLAKEQNKLANNIHPEWTDYSAPYAAQQLGLAQQLFNSRMPGASTIENGIQTSQANFNNNVQRNATDGSQALSLAGLGQGTANNGYNQLGAQEGAYQSQMVDNLNKAYGVMTDVGYKKWQTQFQKYQIDSNAQTALRQGSWNNKIGAWNDLGSTAVGYDQYLQSQTDKVTGMGGGGGGLFGN